MAKKWWQKRERGGKFFLKLSFILVNHTPNFLLYPIVFFVSFTYYLICKEERENIRFYLNLYNKKFNKSKNNSFANFYNFSISICDKIKVWIGKISFDNINILDIDKIEKDLVSPQKGHVIVTSHFGNVEIARALSSKIDGFNITILMYTKHSAQFVNFINSISKSKFDVLEVDELDINLMLKLKQIVDSGGHIAVMGDRVSINEKKKLSCKFLAMECDFNIGAYILASLLNSPLSVIWCVKEKNRYNLSYKNLANSVVLGRDRFEGSKKYLQLYVDELESMVEKYPYYWFNFFDFWRVRDEQ